MSRRNLFRFANKLIVAQRDICEKSLGMLALAGWHIRTIKFGARDLRYSLFVEACAILAVR
jgi:hypothetical protein